MVSSPAMQSLFDWRPVSTSGQARSYQPKIQRSHLNARSKFVSSYPAWVWKALIDASNGCLRGLDSWVTVSWVHLDSWEVASQVLSTLWSVLWSRLCNRGVFQGRNFPSPPSTVTFQRYYQRHEGPTKRQSWQVHRRKWACYDLWIDVWG